jgi:hypothetical protein
MTVRSTFQICRSAHIFLDNAEETNEELGIRANIWPAYLEEAFERDSEMLDAWHKTLDVLLIFVSHPRIIIFHFGPC